MAKVSEKPSTTRQGMSTSRVTEDDEEELLHEGFFTCQNKPSDNRPNVGNKVYFAYLYQTQARCGLYYTVCVEQCNVDLKDQPTNETKTNYLARMTSKLVKM